MNSLEGDKLISLARESINRYFDSKEIKDENFKEKRGVFVTLLTLNDELRGCIGFVEPWFSVSEGVIKVAREAAFNDPRFLPLNKNEEFKLVVSVLTNPELIKVSNSEDYLELIKIGRDGLIIEFEDYKGLLLPGVPKEQGWDVKEFLDNLCLKAGLLEGTWRNSDCKIYKFTSEVFKEKV